MRDFNTKIDNDNTSAGVVIADEYNSMFNEAKGAITPFMGLNEADNKQLTKSIDIASKAMFYTDAGAPNSVILSRSATTETTETLFDGMVIFFAPANANTGATTLKVKTLDAKDLKYNGADLTVGFLATNSKYIAVYSVANNRFDVDLIVNYKNLNDAISGIDLSAKADKTEVIGINQTWQDLTASRALNVTYTNTSGKPIQVKVNTTSSGTSTLNLNIDGITIDVEVVEVSGRAMYVSGIVPNGSTYIAQLSAGSYATWKELR